MDSAPAPSHRIKPADLCNRCLQPVPRKASRCPNCREPHSNRGYLPLLIGVAGICALAFVMALMYYAAWRSDMSNAPPLADESQKDEIMVAVPAADAKPQPDNSQKTPPANNK